MVRHFLDTTDFTKKEILDVIRFSRKIKATPQNYVNAMKDKTLLMIFAKPSLRTRLSFEVGMTEMGGHGIYYDISTSVMGKKETITDTAKTAARYCDIVMARLFEHKDIEEYASNSTIPVINALTNYSHPCQIIADLMTIQEKKERLEGLKLTYCGDGNNNVTHSLLLGCAAIGMNITVACPKGKEYEPQMVVVEKTAAFAEENGTKFEITHDASAAVKDADIVYTDSWMSYHIPKEKEAERVSVFKPYQVTPALLEKAKKDVVFMNCLPAMRGYEQTAEVIDGPHSIVFDQAENRLHAQKAIMLFLSKGNFE